MARPESTRALREGGITAAGDSGTYCKHRFALMDGVAEDLLSGNESDVHKLKGLMAGTDLEKIYREVVNIQAEYDKIGERLKWAKKELARAMRG